MKNFCLFVCLFVAIGCFSQDLKSEALEKGDYYCVDGRCVLDDRAATENSIGSSIPSPLLSQDSLSDESSAGTVRDEQTLDLTDENRGSTGNLKPYISKDWNPDDCFADYVFSADNPGKHDFVMDWFENPVVTEELTYSVDSSLSFVDVEIDSRTGNFSIVTTNEVGSGSFTITASNSCGSCSIPVYVYCGKVVGYTVEERSYGSSWNSVQDRGNGWALLWNENEYLWKPVFSAASPGGDRATPADYQVKTVAVTSRRIGTISMPLTVGSGRRTLTYDSGRSIASYDVPQDYWPCAVGKPGVCGEHEISISVTLEGGSVEGFGHCLGHNSVTLQMTDREKYYCPRIGFDGIQSVSWIPVDIENKIRLTTDPRDENKLRCFPELCSDLKSCDGTSRDILQKRIDVRVTLESPIPVGMNGTVYVDFFDPKNPLGVASDNPNANRTGVGVRDNNGTGGLGRTELFVSSRSPEATTSFSFSQAQPGDNYIVVSHPNNIISTMYRIEDLGDVPNCSSIVKRAPFEPNENNSIWTAVSNNLQSKELTVWRTLWIERDYLESSNAESLGKTAGLPLIDMTVADALSNACVRVDEYTQTDAQRSILVNDDTFVNFDESFLRKQRTSSFAVNNFWTVRAIGCFNLQESDGLGFYKDNNVFVANDVVETVVKNWNNQRSTSISADIVKRIIVLHEIGHALGICHGNAEVIPSLLANVPLNEISTFTIDELREIQKLHSPLRD